MTVTGELRAVVTRLRYPRYPVTCQGSGCDAWRRLRPVAGLLPDRRDEVGAMLLCPEHVEQHLAGEAIAVTSPRGHSYLLEARLERSPRPPDDDFAARCMLSRAPS